MTLDFDLLYSLPETCLVKDFPQNLLDHQITIAEILKDDGVSLMFERFKREMEAKIEIQCGLQFASEGAQVTRGDSDEYMVDFQSAILGLYLAREALDLGFGRDPGIDAGLRKLLKLTGWNYMTFQHSDGAVFPTLNFDEVEISQSQMNEIISVIHRGRDLIPNRNRFGVYINRRPGEGWEWTPPTYLP